MSQNDFMSRLGQWVLRTDPIGEPREYQLYKPSDPAKAYEVASFYMSLQEIGITFKPILKVQTVDNAVCTACEG